MQVAAEYATKVNLNGEALQYRENIKVLQLHMFY